MFVNLHIFDSSGRFWLNGPISWTWPKAASQSNKNSYVPILGRPVPVTNFDGSISSRTDTFNISTAESGFSVDTAHKPWWPTLCILAQFWASIRFPYRRTGVEATDLVHFFFFLLDPPQLLVLEEPFVPPGDAKF